MLKCISSNSLMKLDIMISPISIDLSKSNETMFRRSFESFFAKHNSISNESRRPQWNLLIHNAGTIGVVSKLANERFDINYLDEYYRLNLTSMITLTSVFMDHFAPSTNPNHAPTTIVNISSLAGVTPFKRMSDYCVGKAARVMYLKCLGLDRPSIAVFNYSPGPLDTEMFHNLVKDTVEAAVKKRLLDLKSNGKVIDPYVSARTCIEWLRRQRPDHSSDKNDQTKRPLLEYCPVHYSEWKNLWEGQVLDYFDTVPETRDS